MTRATWGFLAILLSTSSAIPYFKYERPIETPAASGQQYAVVDETVWPHALPNLDDLRLFAAGKEIPYARRTMRGSRETEQKTIRLLQPATLGGKTQFLLDMAGVAEYDRVTLMLVTKNYVAHARVDGQDDSHGTQWASLGATTLFDLSEEKLGHNSTLQIPLSTYKYLRVTIDGQVKPSDIQGATAGSERAQEAVWRDLSSEPKLAQEGKDTVLTFTISANVPVERLMLAIDPSQGNFQREIEMQGDKGVNDCYRGNQPHSFATQRRKNRHRTDLAFPWRNERETVARRHPQWRRCAIKNYPCAPSAVRAADLF